MKKTLFALCAAAGILSAAEITMYQDNFRLQSWRIINTKDRPKVENKTLIVDTDKRLLPGGISIRGAQPFGTRFRITITNTTQNKYKLGFLFRDAKRKNEFAMSKDLQGKGSFEFTLPRKAVSVTPIIWGKGKYKNIKVVRLIDNDYRVAAYPSYQLVKDPAKAEKVAFKLFHKEKEVPNGKIQINGLSAAHETGATTEAFIVKGDPAPFEKIAQNIKIKKNVNILYIGDSLTHFDYGFNHTDKVGYFLNKFNPSKVQVWNYACGGDDIDRIVKRLNGNRSGRWGFRYDDLWKRSYDWAFIFLGHNDTKANSKDNYKIAVVPPAKQKAEYEKLIKFLQAKGVKRIVLMSASSSNFELCKKNADSARIKLKRHVNRFGDPAHQEAFNKVLIDLAKKYKLEYMDIYTPMKALKNKASLLNPHDGVHLSPAGHDFVAIETLKYLSETNSK
jgi:lysophospholipase L1-like esterase